MLASRTGRVPPLELHVAAGVATLVRFDVLLSGEAPEAMGNDGRIELVQLGEGSWVFVPSTDLGAGEQVVLAFATEPGAEPLRVVLVTRRDAVDLRVHVMRAPLPSEDDGAEPVARSLLDAPDARVLLDVPREAVESNGHEARGRVDSVLWMGRRFFATVAVRSRGKGIPLWKLARARLRATLAGGDLLEWPAHLLSGAAGAIRQRHIVTGLLPEGASRLELALDGEELPGDFQPLSPEAEPARR
jgi:hypothetical protein